MQCHCLSITKFFVCIPFNSYTSGVEIFLYAVNENRIQETLSVSITTKEALQNSTADVAF
jgi:hypothetical protein